ncbi:MAG: tryptophan synthase subunit alpha, partial [Saprospiraceae bacterium]|nr:tryptophan synthase subunit alpha [Saprospiraceae bacterium]
MNRLTNLFERKKRDILNIYFTAGYPNLNDTLVILKRLEELGVDMVEIGMPYSDPLADGATIQQTSQLALKNGMTLDILFEQLATMRSTIQLPVVLMGYFNQVLQYGEERFFEQCSKVGIDGLILPDLPLIEYELKYKQLFETYNLKATFLITPQTTTPRV